MQAIVEARDTYEHQWRRVSSSRSTCTKKQRGMKYAWEEVANRKV